MFLLAPELPEEPAWEEDDMVSDDEEVFVERLERAPRRKR